MLGSGRGGGGGGGWGSVGFTSTGPANPATGQVGGPGSTTTFSGPGPSLNNTQDGVQGVPQQQGQQQGQGQAQGGGANGPLDSITLGQLRSLVSFQKPKAKQYDFPSHADSDTLRAELDEFYSYVEAPQTGENRAAWEEWCSLTRELSSASNQGAEGGTGAEKERAAAEEEDAPAGAPGELAAGGGALGLGLGLDTGAGQAQPESKNGAKKGAVLGEWTTRRTSERRRTIQALLSTLEVRDPAARLRASRALLYLLQGAFADTTGPEHQLHWILENARMVRAQGGLGEVFAAMKIVCWKHDWLSSLPDHIPSSEAAKEGRAPAPLLTPHAKLEYLDEINLELALHFAQLYILVETGRGDEEWGDELMSLDPALPIYLFGLVASLREKNAKGYPVKKLLLLLWKSILACFGGMKDVDRCKKLARELEGLQSPAADKNSKRGVTKATPLDFQSFQQEITVKYPTFNPPSRQPNGLPTDKIASAIAPIPVRRPLVPVANGGVEQGQPGMGQGNMPWPGTPAPSPPPSPKPNKQKYQTDQTRPFVFPFSRRIQGARLVPYSIEEAGRLYHENMHVSLEMWQMWRLREQCIQEESGVSSAEDGSRVGLGVPGQSGLMSRRSSGEAGAGTGPSPLSRMDASSSGTRSPGGESTSGTSASGEKNFKTRGEPTLDQLQELEAELDEELQRVEADHLLAVVDNARYLKTISRLREQRAAARRLQRVDALYRAVLPNLQSAVIVLLKLLLATVTAQNSTNSPHAQAVADGVAPEEAPPPTLEDIDIMRHREITSKAVSAILLLCLKWFKASHAMKFHYLSQLLVDSNCLLLILKMFGLQEVSNAVRAQNEAEDFNFFRYCYLNGGREPRQPRPEDSLLARPHTVARPASHDGPGPRPPSPPGPITIASGEEVELITDYSWRNFFSSINFTRILQKLTKRKVHRILLLVQYKSSAILKRTLKVSHPMLQLYVLKVIKSQVPFCGRKWRQSNMKVITAIYLNCRPDLRDEWLAGADVDADVEDSLPQEQALRSLVKYYNSTRFGTSANAVPGHSHRRSLSSGLQGSGLGEDMPAGTLDPASAAAHHLSPGRAPPTSFFESDVLPPLRRSTESTAGTLRYIPDDVVEGYLDTYEDVLGEVFGDAHEGDLSAGWGSGKWGLTQEGAGTAWARLGEILGDADAISDSESISSIGELGLNSGDGSQSGELFGGAGGAGGQRSDEDRPRDENRNDWEHMSPKEMRFLTSQPASQPGSPLSDRHRRHSSSGSSGKLSRSNSDSSPLRPVLSFGPEELLAMEAESDDAVEDELEVEQVQPLPQPQAGGIDEVEHIFGT